MKLKCDYYQKTSSVAVAAELPEKVQQKETRKSKGCTQRVFGEEERLS